MSHFLLRSGGPKDLKIPAQIQDLTFQCCGPTILEHSNLGKIEQNRVYTTSTKKKSYIFLCIVSVNRHESMAFLYVYMRHVSRETHGVRISLILKTCVQGSLSAFRTLRLLSSVSAWPAAFVSNSPAVGYPRAESYLVWWRWQYWVEANSRYFFVHSSISTRKKHDSSDWFKMCAKNISRPVEENMIYIYIYNILHIEKQILYNWSIRVAPCLYHIYKYYI